jgi:hypothetical protein
MTTTQTDQELRYALTLCHECQGSGKIDWDEAPRYTYGGKAGYFARPSPAVIYDGAEIGRQPRMLFAEEELLLAILGQAVADGVELPANRVLLFAWLIEHSREYFARFAHDWPIDLDRLTRGFLWKMSKLLRERPL